MKIAVSPPKKARIEIIPMIDVIFFLLVFFMMTSMAMTTLNSKRVELPQSSSAALNPDEKIAVTIAPDGKTYLEQQEVAEAQLVGLLAPKIAANPAATVVLNCDKNQPVARFSRAFDLIKQAGVQNVMVATKEDESRPAAAQIAEGQNFGGRP